MKSNIPYGVLFIDDEEKILKSFKRFFNKILPVYVAHSGGVGLKILEKNSDKIGILIVDQRMPSEEGTEILEKVRQLYPGIIRILTSAHPHINSAISSVNKGAVYKYILKPWDIDRLRENLLEAMDYFIKQKERSEKLNKKLAAFNNEMVIDKFESYQIFLTGFFHHFHNAVFPIHAFITYWLPLFIKENEQKINGSKDTLFWEESYKETKKELKKLHSFLDKLNKTIINTECSLSDKIVLKDIFKYVLTNQNVKYPSKETSIKIDIPDSLPSLYVNKRLFITLIEMLIESEYSYLEPDGKIEISAKVINYGDKNKDKIEFILKDNFKYIQPYKKTVSEPLLIRKRGSSEIDTNLMTCFFIIQLHGGKMDIFENEDEYYIKVELPATHKKGSKGSFSNVFSKDEYKLANVH